jgi:bacillithiol system protein YtxJ
LRQAKLTPNKLKQNEKATCYYNDVTYRDSAVKLLRTQQKRYRLPNDRQHHSLTTAYRMNWIDLTTESQLAEIKERSFNRPQVIFKHSTRCSISAVTKNRLERSVPPGNADFYYLDLIQHRTISNKIAADFSVYHESPQVLLIKNGECVYDESHSGINMDEITDQANII